MSSFHEMPLNENLIRTLMKNINLPLPPLCKKKFARLF